MFVIGVASYDLAPCVMCCADPEHLHLHQIHQIQLIFNGALTPLALNCATLRQRSCGLVFDPQLLLVPPALKPCMRPWLPFCSQAFSVYRVTKSQPVLHQLLGSCVQP